MMNLQITGLLRKDNLQSIVSPPSLPTYNPILLRLSVPQIFQTSANASTNGKNCSLPVEEAITDLKE